jgi:hypothetical protein
MKHHLCLYQRLRGQFDWYTLDCTSILRVILDRSRAHINDFWVFGILTVEFLDTNYHLPVTSSVESNISSCTYTISGNYIEHCDVLLPFPHLSAYFGIPGLLGYLQAPPVARVSRHSPNQVVTITQECKNVSPSR